MRQLTTLVRLTMVAISLAATPICASDVEADISGDLAGWLSLDPSANVSNGQIYGDGQLPHLGNSRLTAVVVVNNVYLPYVPAFPQFAVYAFVLSDLQLTAANGDGIVGICGPTMYDVNTGKLSWDIIFWGGTGRFAEATGYATLEFQLPLQDWEYQADYQDGEFQLIDATLNY